jgi:hypothetical protein
MDRGIRHVVLDGSGAVTPTATTVYTLVGTNGAGKTAAATARVPISAAPQAPAALPPVNSFSASPPDISTDDSAGLSSDASDATVVTIDQGIGAVASPRSRGTVSCPCRGGVVFSVAAMACLARRLPFDSGLWQHDGQCTVLL